MPRKVLLILLVTLAGTTLLANPALRDAWTLVSIYRFEEAVSAFAAVEGRQARLGEATALLNVQPKTEENVDRAAALLDEVAASDPRDDAGLTARYYLNESPFPIGVCNMPLPRADREGAAPRSFGPLGENNLTGVGGFGLVRGSKNRDQALDFLRYMTSKSVNERYAALVQRVPVIVGAAVDPSVAAFTPNPKGRSFGVSLDFSSLGGTGLWTQRLVVTRMFQLVSPSTNVDEFLRDFAPAFDDAVRKDARFFAASSRKNLARTDSVIAALSFLEGEGDSPAFAKASRMLENQRLLTADVLQVEDLLAEAP